MNHTDSKEKNENLAAMDSRRVPGKGGTVRYLKQRRGMIRLSMQSMEAAATRSHGKFKSPLKSR